MFQYHLRQNLASDAFFRYTRVKHFTLLFTYLPSTIWNASWPNFDLIVLSVAAAREVVIKTNMEASVRNTTLGLAHL